MTSALHPPGDALHVVLLDIDGTLYAGHSDVAAQRTCVTIRIPCLDRSVTIGCGTIG